MDSTGTGDANTTQTSNTTDDSRAEFTAQLEDLLNTMSNKFAGVSSEIFAKMDEMSRRLDNLESQLKENSKSSGSS